MIRNKINYKFLELEENQSMTEDVVAKIYEESVETSYRKAGVESTPEGITKQTGKSARLSL